MALILNIDTATDIASICIGNDGECVALEVNTEARNHAAWLQPAIQQLLQKNNIALHDLQAVAVTAGPGSYTGLRVGMASAKGICYACKIPFITENTLKVMALASRNLWQMQGNGDVVLFCPMIDARRMEVFCGVYTPTLEEVTKPGALIVDEGSFSELLQENKIVFSGNGSEKTIPLIKNDHAIFQQVTTTALHLNQLAYHKFQQADFTDLAYSEPQYLKEFHSTQK